MTLLKDAYDAVRERDIIKLKVLLAADETLPLTETPFGPLLHVAAAVGDEEIVELLLAAGADVDARGGVLGGSALNYAASKGQLEIVRCLLGHSAKIDTSEPEHNPLFSAIYAGNIEIVKLLLDVGGVDKSIRYSGDSMKNMDAKAFAIERGQSGIAAFL